jgi:dihydroorotate dehydrogenase
MGLDTLALRALRRFEPEAANNLALRFLRSGLQRGSAHADDAALRCSVLGLSFPNPIGLAAGCDKNAKAVSGLLKLGFGSVEVGTVTPYPQKGHPGRRVFRWRAESAIVNHMGFPNDGLEQVMSRLGRLPARVGPVGVNLGKNKDSADAAADYAAGVAAAAPHADFLVINVSSPNTPGLRALQKAQALQPILEAALAARRKAPNQPPLLVKVSPDVTDEEAEAFAETVLASGVEGMVVANTTTGRPPEMPPRLSARPGGLSGPPLMALSTRLLRRIARTARGRLVLFGVGGISSGDDVFEKIRAGASIVQLYTAFAYRGPGLLSEIKGDLIARLRADGFSSVADAVGTGLD